LLSLLGCTTPSLQKGSIKNLASVVWSDIDAHHLAGVGDYQDSGADDSLFPVLNVGDIREGDAC